MRDAKPDLNCEIVGEVLLNMSFAPSPWHGKLRHTAFCDISRETSARFIGEALLDIIDHCVAKIQPRQRRRIPLKFPSLSPAALTQGQTSWSPSNNDLVEFVFLSKRVFEGFRGPQSTRVSNGRGFDVQLWGFESAH